MNQRPRPRPPAGDTTNYARCLKCGKPTTPVFPRYDAPQSLCCRAAFTVVRGEE